MIPWGHHEPAPVTGSPQQWWTVLRLVQVFAGTFFNNYLCVNMKGPNKYHSIKEKAIVLLCCLFLVGTLYKVLGSVFCFQPVKKLSNCTVWPWNNGEKKLKKNYFQKKINGENEQKFLYFWLDKKNCLHLFTEKKFTAFIQDQTSKVGSIGGTMACGSWDPSSRLAWGKLVWTNILN